ncbi:MAG: DUF1565 domain-containing protein [Cyanobacteria bacterium P01_C01_bin.72]
MENSDYQNHRLKCSLGWLAQLQQFTSLLLAAAIITLPCQVFLLANPAIAQGITQSPSLSKNTIYVNSQRGDDSQTGKKLSPLKTITQALKIAKTGSKIQLASGTYSEDSGETFPLIIQNKIILQGDSRNQGYKTIIVGDGYFVSPTGAGQNVAIAAVKDAGGIIGITVTNNHSRGHGLWVESASPKIISNTFTRSGNTGVSLNGKSFPLVEDNYFYNNSGNGLLVYGTSQPQIKQNTFEQTGFGISLVQNSVAQIDGNIFDGNRIGIILEGNSQGILRNNEIINSAESGLTAISKSRVDLGTDNAPGNNVFRSNKKLDIQNATDEEIVAVGTESNGKTQGKVNFDNGTFIATQTKEIPTPTIRDLFPLPARRQTVLRPIPQSSIKPAIEPPPANLPAPPPVLASNKGNKELVFNPSTSNATMILDLEPVPYPPNISRPATNTAPVKYKVLVEVLNEREANEVRSLYPEAFSTVYQGESWLQVGAFSNRDKAKRAEQNLVNLGLETYFLE